MIEELERGWIERVPFDYQDAGLADLDPTVRTGIEETWMKTLGDTKSSNRLRGPNLVLFGPPGTGKTHAAFAAMRVLWFDGITSKVRWGHDRKQGRSFAYWAVAELAGKLRDRSVSLEQLLEPQVLFLDDIGTMKATEFAQEQLYTILNARRVEVLPIVATTNLDMDGLRTHLGGEPPLQRLVGDAVLVNVKGHNRRRMAKPVQLVRP